MRLEAAIVLGLWLAFGGGAGAAPDAADLLRELLKEPFAPGSGGESLGNVSLDCLQHSRAFLRELANGTSWAVRMFDASAKVPAGVLASSGDVIGDYDQCLEVFAPSQGFSGKYCTASITCLNCASDTSSPGSQSGGPPEAAGYQVGVCVPSSCSSKDVEEHLGDMLADWVLRTDVHAVAELRPGDCHTARSTNRAYAPADYAFLALMALIAALLIVGTGYDVYLQRNPSKDAEKGGNVCRTALLAFSVKTNVPPLFNTSSPDGSLGCINGIRFLSIAWVVVFHAHAAVYRTPRTNDDQTSRFKQRWYMMIMMNGSLSTDSFLLIGGVLLAYIFMRERKKNHSFNIVTFYLHRYTRVTPAYAVVIFFYATMLYHLGSGPMWDEFIKDERRKCVDWWYSNLLYVNNYNSNENTCIVQSWYLATDMQFYWLSPLILYPLWRWPKAGWTLLVAALVASTTALMAVTASYSGENFSRWYEDNWNLTYTPVYTRAGPYLLGLALGYLLQVIHKDFSMSKMTVVAGWVTSMALLAVTLFGGYRLRQDVYSYQPVEVTLYEGLHRTLWSVALSWVVFACVKGYGGPVNDVLSSRVMLPLGKLSYCVYLCHFAIIYARLGLTRTPVHIWLGDVFLDGAMTLIISIVISIPLTLAFEIPFLIIDKNILVKRIAMVSERVRAASLPVLRGTFSLQNHGSSSIVSANAGIGSSSTTISSAGIGSSSTVYTVDIKTTS